MALRDVRASQRYELSQLERMQSLRIERWERQKMEIEDLIERKQREINNLRATLDNMS